MATEEIRGQCDTPTHNRSSEDTGHPTGRRMSQFKEYKFFRSFSAKVENWPMRKAEALWRRMREKKIAGTK